MPFQTKVAAIEIDDYEVRLAVVAVGGRKPTLLECHSAAIQELEHNPDAEADGAEQNADPQFFAKVRALETCLDRLSQRPAAYVLCAKVRYSVVRVLSIPFRGARRVAAAVPFELEPHLAFPLEELLVDFNTITEVEGETEVLAMGMRRAHLENQVAVLQAAGIGADAVSLDAIGFANLWQTCKSGAAKGLDATVHVRPDSAVITVNFNKTLAYVRYLPFTAQQLLDTPEAAARDIQNSLRAFLAKWRAGGEIDTIHFTGIAINAYEQKALEDALRLPVEANVMLDQISGVGKALADADPGLNIWEPLVGAALGAAGKGQTLDFTRNQQTWQSDMRGVLAHLMFSACIALLVLLGWAFYYFQATARNQSEAVRIREEINTINNEALALSEKGLGDKVETSVFSDPNLLEILRDIAAKMPEEKAVLTEFRMAAPGSDTSWIRIQGLANSSDDCRSIYEDLKTSPYVTVEDNPEMKLQDGKTAFEIIAYRKTAQEQGSPL